MFLAAFWQDPKGKQWDLLVFFTCIPISRCLQPQVVLFFLILKYYTQPVLLYSQKDSLRCKEKYTKVSNVLLTLRNYSPSYSKQACWRGLVVRTDELTDASLHVEPMHTLGLALGVDVPQGLTDVQGHIFTACDLSAILCCLTLASTNILQNIMCM